MRGKAGSALACDLKGLQFKSLQLWRQKMIKLILIFFLLWEIKDPISQDLLT
jgi:hypothetical protein